MTAPSSFSMTSRIARNARLATSLPPTAPRLIHKRMAESMRLERYSFVGVSAAILVT